MLIVPPGSGIVHQVNLEYLARVVFAGKGKPLLYPDTVVSIALLSVNIGFVIIIVNYHFDLHSSG